MVCPFGIINPSASMKVAIKCDRCRNMGYPICAEVCPTQAIKGEKKQNHLILEEICSKCGSCMDVCKANAVMVQ
jgi:Fe-S-cluster-containing hydrogenase component 2